MKRKTRRERSETQETLPGAASHPRVSEQLLIEATVDLQATRVLCTSLGRAQFAAAFAARSPAARVSCVYLDVFQARRARDETAGQGGHVEITCQADFPAEPCDLVAIPLTAHGEAELARDWLQSGHERLVTGGQLVATTDNPRDRWLREQMLALFPKVTRREFRQGVAYLGTKAEPLRKRKNFVCQFAFRDRERLIHALSRPGVFSHRHLDVGSRALIESLEVASKTRVLELGCGWGAVSFAAACRAPDVHVTAIDSNARAIECTQRGAAWNELANVSTKLDAEADPGEAEERFDLVVTNPPYYSHMQISDIFLRSAARWLKPGGELLVVTKHPQAYESHLPDDFWPARYEAVRGYTIIRAQRT